MLTAFPQCNFSLEFQEILSQNLKCYHRLSVSGNSEIMNCGILINLPYSPYDSVLISYIGYNNTGKQEGDFGARDDHKGRGYGGSRD